MTPEQLKAAIDVAIGNKIILSYSQMMVLVLLAGVAAYLGAYLKKKGENLATSDDVRRLTEKTEEIKTIYTKQIEDYKNELARQAKIAKVGEFFTEWSAPNPDFVKLNGYALELSLWLPAELYRKLGRCICHETGAPTPKQILIDIRKHLLRDDAGDLKPEEIIHFNHPEK